MKVIQLYALRLSIKNPKNRMPRGVKPFNITVEDPPEFQVEGANATSIMSLGYTAEQFTQITEHTGARIAHVA